MKFKLCKSKFEYLHLVQLFKSAVSRLLKNLLPFLGLCLDFRHKRMLDKWRFMEVAWMLPCAFPIHTSPISCVPNCICNSAKSWACMHVCEWGSGSAWQNGLVQNKKYVGQCWHILPAKFVCWPAQRPMLSQPGHL